VRFNLNGDGSAVVSVKEMPHRPSKARPLTINRTLTLTKSEIGNFLEQVDSLGFWQISSREDPANLGPDGAL
jgi:hypothetical protein